MGQSSSTNLRQMSLGALLALCGFAMAGVFGTPFEDLGTEVDQRTDALDGTSSNRERRALRHAARELRRVDRGLVKDLAAAGRIGRHLERAYPADSEIDALIAGLLDALATRASSRIFDAEQALDEAGGIAPERAYALVDRARERESMAAVADTTARRTKLLRRAVRAAKKAEAALHVATPPNTGIPVDPPTDPAATTTGTATFGLNGTTVGTQAVAAHITVYPDGNGAMEFQLDADVPSASHLGVTFAWSHAGGVPTNLGFPIGTSATGSMRRGGVTFDRLVEGEVRMTGMKASTATETASMSGTFRIAASDMNGNRLSVTGTFDITAMPQTFVR